MKLTKITLALSCAAALAFAACGKKDEAKSGEETPAAKTTDTETAAGAATEKPALPEADKAEAAGDEAAGDEAAGDEAADDEAAAGGTEITPEVMEKAMGMMKDFSQAAIDNKDDCKAMATAMDKVLTDNADLMKQAKNFRNDPAAQKMFEEKYKGDMEKVMMGMMGAMQKCGNDPGVMEVMKKMR